MSKYVVSTLGAHTNYAGWVDDGSGRRKIAHAVLVKGGAGIAAATAGKPTTPEGVLTPISARDADFLVGNDHFKRHQARGFVKIIDRDRDPNTVAQSMTKDDGSRPRNTGDVERFSKDKSGKSEDAPTLSATTNSKK